MQKISIKCAFFCKWGAQQKMAMTTKKFKKIVFKEKFQCKFTNRNVFDSRSKKSR